MREIDALRGLAEGKVYKQIAQELSLSVSTVRTHLHNVYRKIGAVDRAQAVLIASDRGWLCKDIRATSSASAPGVRERAGRSTRSGAAEADRDRVGAVAGLEAGEGGLGVGADRLGAEPEALRRHLRSSGRRRRAAGSRAGAW